MGDLFVAEDVPEIECPACGKEFPASEEPQCPACAWTPADGDAPRRRVPPAPVTPVADAGPSQVPGKPRNILVCILLGVITLGIYFLFWHYAAFEEVRLHTRTRQRVELFWTSITLSVIGVVWVLVEAGSIRAAGADGFRPSPSVIVLQAAAAGALATYLYIETRHLRQAVRSAGIPSMAWPGGFLLVAALQVAAYARGDEFPDLLPVLMLIVALLAYPLVQMTLNAYWRQVRASAASASANATTG
jgi:hypothetical protein